MFVINKQNGSVTMHQGDTGAYRVSARRKSGEEFTANDRMLFTVRNGAREIVMQRFYRLDTDLGNGEAIIQFHNNDTDTWPVGTYSAERRYVINPRWTGTPPEGDCVNAMTAGVEMNDGDVVRTPVTGQHTITISDVYGEV